MADSQLKIAMLGMVDGNGHPYSWSAIINGQYDAKEMIDCGYPVIPEYLKANESELGIAGAKVTHVWADDPEDSKKIARASCIENVVEKPEDVIGKVDAVCIATDIGSEHLKRVEPFLEAGIPIFIDKPLADNASDLREFIKLIRGGKKILSSSSMRYSPEVLSLNDQDIGKLRLLTGFTCKSWARYGIHALEGAYQVSGPGYISVRDVGEKDRHTVMMKHSSGADVLLWAYYHVLGGFGAYQAIGEKASAYVKQSSTFISFKRQLESFVSFAKTGEYPFPVEETFELIAIIAAAEISLRGGGREVLLTEVIPASDMPAKK